MNNKKTSIRKSSRTASVQTKTPVSDQEYEVERIVAKKIKNGQVLYKVKWIGYPLSDCTFETIENLEGSKKLVKLFEAGLVPAK